MAATQVNHVTFEDSDIRNWWRQDKNLFKSTSYILFIYFNGKRMWGKELRLGHYPRQTTWILLKKHFQQEAERGNNKRKSNEKQPETKKKKKRTAT